MWSTETTEYFFKIRIPRAYSRPGELESLGLELRDMKHTTFKFKRPQVPGKKM